MILDFFKAELSNINEILLDYSEEERLDFFKFATALGCFSTEKMLDKNGKEMQSFLAQKASSLLVQLLKTDEMKLGKYHGLFDSMPFGTKPNQEFLKFINILGKKRKFDNLEIVMSLEKKHHGMFTKIMIDFNKAKSYRKSLSENGKPITISWREALKKFYLDVKYEDITPENEDIAELFGSRGLSQEVFKVACELRRKAKEMKIPEHILGKSIREESILESIERIKNQTEANLQSGKQIIEELYKKQFTYEWLSKNDPRNIIMGLFCSCCGTITSGHYGKDIAQASLESPNVQNLIIRNFKGEIISKGTMYVNIERGYAVINDFELNEQYRKHEIDSGRYRVDAASSEEQEREMIFEAFQRGIEAFVEEYDKQNPNNPLKQINIGMGYNRLKRQVERFEVETQKLTVPAEYNFQDAMKHEQYILYKRGENTIER